MTEIIKLLPYNNTIGEEIRPLYFYSSFNLPIAECRLISFGSCNFNCPYCKRNGFFRTKDGSIIFAKDTNINNVFQICDDAICKNQIIRLSGGDPITFIDASLKIAEHVKKRNGRLSLAHNGSSPNFVFKMADFLESAAIDLKATPKYMSMITGLKQVVAINMYYRSLESQNILTEHGVLVDIRTPIFDFNTIDDLIILLNDINRYVPSNNKFWTLRLYKKIKECNFNAPNKNNVVWMANEIKRISPNLKIGIRAEWDPKGFIYL